MVEAVSAAQAMGKSRRIARACEIKPRGRRILAARRESLRIFGEAKFDQVLLGAPAKRSRLSRLEHVFDL
jgi:hypothetical protein